ncbi:TPA: 3-hydroxy-3-methylglutaryl-CoA lyase, partial [Enterococcus faecium]|nr:3-hydroxy-3-methylglutaryl-CoA lyase [Enterococcus faecium]HAY1220438.1 3-hydroxy-3-methylglutaryl-CoA lyase [Enterococcus faecium]HAZ5884315.1 3-hydroxy-3-methylglutaryl-CoA lyase [Enterococcus faecium]HAZ9613715.1 3-hydroxy-3-methylglutaryl-CoA lyase [Enterococcus faecium]HCD6096280.1 aldolase catalytic domain-containing protein [Enterococcus faecium]
MNNVQILDCTLRDGGYCNNWEFGFDNTKKIISGLIESGIEIIECGFLTNKTVYNKNVTKYTTLEELAQIIPEKREGKLFVAMMNYGEYNIEDLPDYDGSSIDGIRIAFHKKNCNEALKLCREIKKKGYLVFVQAMVSLNYTDEEFLAVIKNVNQFKPYAFYIVDSFGMMKGKDLTRLFYMIEHNLEKDIQIGFHSHNNMQLAYSNAQKLITVQTNRSLIIDSSVYGMGRGAGNLNTELFVEYLNDNAGKKYQLKPLLYIIDEILNSFYQKSYWGYSLPNYISAVHNAHPNYASYLSYKNTLTIEAMNEIFEMMDEEKKVSYDKQYIEDLYYKYMETGKIQEEYMEELRKFLSDKKILLIAPGKSSVDEVERIKEFVTKEEVVIISVN